MKPKNPIHAILETLAAQQQQGEAALTVSIAPDLIQDALNIPGHRKLFAPVIPGTDTAPIYAAYEQLQQAGKIKTILVLVECQTIAEFRRRGHPRFVSARSFRKVEIEYYARTSDCATEKP